MQTPTELDDGLPSEPIPLILRIGEQITQCFFCEKWYTLYQKHCQKFEWWVNASSKHTVHYTQCPHCHKNVQMKDYTQSGKYLKNAHGLSEKTKPVQYFKANGDSKLFN
jgi:hypothetical protein